MKKKAFRIVALVLSLLGAVSSIFGVASQMFKSEGIDWSVLKMYTNLSNLIYAIVALIAASFLLVALIEKKDHIPAWVEFLYLFATIGLTLTFVIVYAYLAPFVMGSSLMIGLPSMLFVHTVSPLLAIITMLIFLKENGLRKTDAIICAASPLIYGLVWVFLQVFKVVDPSVENALPYPFLNITVDWWIPTVWFVGIIAGTALIALLWIVIHNAGIPKAVPATAAAEETPAPAEEAKPAEEHQPAPVSAAPVAEKKEEPKGATAPEPKSEPQKMAAPVTEPSPAETGKKEENKTMKKEAKPVAKKAAAKPAPKAAKPAPKAAKTAAKPAPKAAKPAAASSSYKDGARIYHVSQYSDGGWQVKLATGDKAIKLFKTQAEAIAYAESLQKTQGGSIRIHSMKGTLRKK